MGEQVYVYWNLHKNLYSVRQGARVRRHASRVQLRDVRFSVGEAGRQRVLREHAKNVHAGMRGRDGDLEPAFQTRGWRRVTYDPYRYDHFVTVSDERPVVGASAVVGVVVDGRARLYARGLEFAE